MVNVPIHNETLFFVLLFAAVILMVSAFFVLLINWTEKLTAKVFVAATLALLAVSLLSLGGIKHLPSDEAMQTYQKEVETVALQKYGVAPIDDFANRDSSQNSMLSHNVTVAIDGRHMIVSPKVIDSSLVLFDQAGVELPQQHTK